MAVSWSAVEDAIRAWFLAGTGLGASYVTWADQNMPAPKLDASHPAYATLLIQNGPRALGQDEQSNTTNLASVGQEITQTIRGQRALTVSCQVYSNINAGDGTAKEYLAKAQTALNLPSLRYALNQAGLSVADSGVILNIDAVIASRFQSRAAMDVDFRLVDTASESSGYIATVQDTESVST